MVDPKLHGRMLNLIGGPGAGDCVEWSAGAIAVGISMPFSHPSRPEPLSECGRAHARAHCGHSIIAREVGDQYNCLLRPPASEGGRGAG